MRISFFSADPFVAASFSTFNQLLKDPRFQELSLIRHLANSEGSLYYPHTHFDMVRPGLLTYGYFSNTLPLQLEEIALCFSVKAKVTYIKEVAEGKGISYGHSFITKSRTKIATIPVGYGDGYPRALSNCGQVLIRGRRFPIVGAICMDQFMVDVGEYDIEIGEEVVLLGTQEEVSITAEEIASLCGTITHEVLCFFNERLPRFYHF